MKKKILLGGLAVILVVLVAGGGYVFSQVQAFDASMATVYDLPAPQVKVSSDPQVIARGQHLAESIGACIDCHAKDLGGKIMADMGPLGIIYTSNISGGGDYTDAELARVLRDGIKRDGTGLVFMPSQDFRWWPDEDVAAVISWLRTQPKVDRAKGPTRIGVLGKVLDRRDLIPIDIARRIDHTKAPATAPEPSASVAYGQFLGKLCQGCHGPSLSGGPIPGAPPSMPIPTNLTPHDTGLKKYSEADFYKTITTGVRPDGSKLAAMMPIATLAAMNDVEKKALWMFLQSVPAKPFGGR